MTKICTKCRVEKDVGEFYRRSAVKDGRASECKSCCNARQQRWREKNPDKRRAQTKRYHEKNSPRRRTQERERSRRYREENPAAVREAQRRYREANPDKGRARVLRRRARLRKGIIGDPGALQERVAEIYTEVCARCGASDDIHVDHIWPLSKGGAHAAFNLQPLCGTCNTKKGAKLPLLLEAA